MKQTTYNGPHTHSLDTPGSLCIPGSQGELSFPLHIRLWFPEEATQTTQDPSLSCQETRCSLFEICTWFPRPDCGMLHCERRRSSLLTQTSTVCTREPSSVMISAGLREAVENEWGRCFFFSRGSYTSLQEHPVARHANKSLKIK